MPHRAVELHLPSLDRDGRAVDRQPWIERAVSLMCDAFGGAYEENVVGHWEGSPTMRLREETCRIVSYVDEERMWSELPRLLDLAEEFKAATNQETVMVAIDNQPLLFLDRPPGASPKAGR